MDKSNDSKESATGSEGKKPHPLDDPIVTKKFIHLRGKVHKNKFQGVKFSNEAGFKAVLEDLGIPFDKDKDVKKCVKKWENLNAKYKKLLRPRSGIGNENGEETKNSWHLFDDMHEVMHNQHNISQPVTISSTVGHEVVKDNVTTHDEDKDSDTSGVDELTSPLTSPASTSSSGKKRRKLITSPNKDAKKKKNATHELIEKRGAKEDDFNENILAILTQEQKEKQKTRKEQREANKANRKQANALISLLAISIAKDNPQANKVIKTIVKDLNAEPEHVSSDTSEAEGSDAESSDSDD